MSYFSGTIEDGNSGTLQPEGFGKTAGVKTEENQMEWMNAVKCAATDASFTQQSDYAMTDDCSNVNEMSIRLTESFFDSIPNESSGTGMNVTNVFDEDHEKNESGASGSVSPEDGTQPLKPKNDKRKHVIWKFVTIKDDKIHCISCGNEIRSPSATNITSHIRRKHPALLQRKKTGCEGQVPEVSQDGNSSQFTDKTPISSSITIGRRQLSGAIRLQSPSEATPTRRPGSTSQSRKTTQASKHPILSFFKPSQREGMRPEYICLLCGRGLSASSFTANAARHLKCRHYNEYLQYLRVLKGVVHNLDVSSTGETGQKLNYEALPAPSTPVSLPSSEYIKDGSPSFVSDWTLSQGESCFSRNADGHSSSFIGQFQSFLSDYKRMETENTELRSAMKAKEDEISFLKRRIAEEDKKRKEGLQLVKKLLESKE